MAYEGALVTAAATAVASAAFGVAAAGTRPQQTGRRTRDISLFLAVTCLFLALSATRQVFAFLSASWTGATDVDRVLFFALIIPAAAAVLPLVHLTGSLLWAHPRVARRMTFAFAGLVLAGIVVTYTGGISGPAMSYWGSEWSLVSPWSKVFLIGVVTLPALACSASILIVGGRLPDPERRHLRTVGAALLVYYVVFTTDALALPGAVLVIERLITAGAAIAILLTYRRHAGAAVAPT